MYDRDAVKASPPRRSTKTINQTNAAKLARFTIGRIDIYDDLAPGQRKQPGGFGFADLKTAQELLAQVNNDPGHFRLPAGQYGIYELLDAVPITQSNALLKPSRIGKRVLPEATV